jgi:polar amino acid transport system substrate-binding protein
VEPQQKFELMSSPDHVALNKNEPRLKALINGVIQQMRTDGSLNKISIEWLKTPLPANF